MKPGILSTIVLASALAAQSTHADVYYWDNTTTTPGFGTAGGTWNSAGSTLWNGDSTGGSAGGLLGTTIITGTSDALNFGTATDGLGAGAISVSGTVIANSLTFGSASGAVVLSGGTAINLDGTTPTITVNNAADTISAIIQGTEGLVKSGDGTLTLSGLNTYTGNLTVDGGTVIGTATNNAGSGAFGSFASARTINVIAGNADRMDAIVKACAPHLFDVSINGADRKGTWRELIRPLDEGNFDVPAFLKSLDTVGYKGAVGLQCFQVPGAPEGHLKRSITQWKKIRNPISESAKP